jgi:hypothetical protein
LGRTARSAFPRWRGRTWNLPPPPIGRAPLTGPGGSLLTKPTRFACQGKVGSHLRAIPTKSEPPPPHLSRSDLSAPRSGLCHGLIQVHRALATALYKYKYQIFATAIVRRLTYMCTGGPCRYWLPQIHGRGAKKEPQIHRHSPCLPSFWRLYLPTKAPLTPLRVLITSNDCGQPALGARS